LIVAAQHVLVHGHRHDGGGVADTLAHHLDRDAAGEEGSHVRVPEIMEADRR
jgi:hypothetical protein